MHALFLVHPGNAYVSCKTSSHLSSERLRQLRSSFPCVKESLHIPSIFLCFGSGFYGYSNRGRMPFYPMCVSVHSHASLWRPETTSSAVSQDTIHLFFETGSFSHLICNKIPLGWLVSAPPPNSPISRSISMHNRICGGLLLLCFCFCLFCLFIVCFLT